ncbi:DUF4266 domain-containing protein [Marinobacter salinexigens]|uniref:DUF4266 domain-containing protein n=1 Tax=Marinobacter salinexigens TaxID=2919747 RepID=A0A5B0VMU5_9GAMM|nr:DUF4266 domain-containing protein [Marinobacter salinexigens]KAA1175714.1 DUF4266 domain-containing protein [Marinobacter salinexigens]
MPTSILFSRRRLRQVGTWLTLSATLAASGCSNLGVKPWERDLLADSDMQLTVSGVDAGLDDHIYFSKEASSGGRGFGGGGCGCN